MSEVTLTTGLNPKLDKAIDVLISCKTVEHLVTHQNWYWNTIRKELDAFERCVYIGAYILKRREIYGT